MPSPYYSSINRMRASSLILVQPSLHSSDPKTRSVPRAHPPLSDSSQLQAPNPGDLGYHKPLLMDLKGFAPSSFRTLQNTPGALPASAFNLSICFVATAAPSPALVASRGVLANTWGLVPSPGWKGAGGGGSGKAEEGGVSASEIHSSVLISLPKGAGTAAPERL